MVILKDYLHVGLRHCPDIRAGIPRHMGGSLFFHPQMELVCEMDMVWELGLVCKMSAYGMQNEIGENLPASFYIFIYSFSKYLLNTYKHWEYSCEQIGQKAPLPRAHPPIKRDKYNFLKVYYTLSLVSFAALG